MRSHITSELARLPPVSEIIAVPNAFAEKLAVGNSVPTSCSTAVSVVELCELLPLLSGLPTDAYLEPIDATIEGRRG